jgi:serine protease Do
LSRRSCQKRYFTGIGAAIAEPLVLGKATGAPVAVVLKGTSAEQSGMRVGGVIIEFDGREVKESNDLPADTDGQGSVGKGSKRG